MYHLHVSCDVCSCCRPMLPSAVYLGQPRIQMRMRMQMRYHHHHQEFGEPPASPVLHSPRPGPRYHRRAETMTSGTEDESSCEEPPKLAGSVSGLCLPMTGFRERRGKHGSFVCIHSRGKLLAGGGQDGRRSFGGRSGTHMATRSRLETMVLRDHGNGLVGKKGRTRYGRALKPC